MSLFQSLTEYELIYNHRAAPHVIIFRSFGAKKEQSQFSVNIHGYKILSKDINLVVTND